MARSKAKKPRSSWEANDVVVKSEDVTFLDIHTIKDDPWIDDVRALLGLPPTIDPGPGRERVLPDSTVDNPTKKVWEICDTMPKASRAEHIAACVAAGVNIHTARTQQSKWAKAHKGL